MYEGFAVNKFILISFGFMGWAFYEMSGGDQFEPASVRMAHLMPKPEPIAEAPVQQATVVQPETETAFVDTDPPVNDEVTRVALNLTELEETLSDTDSTEQTSAVLQPSTTEEDTGVPRNAGSISQSADTPAIIPSLIAPAAETTQVAVASVGGFDDIRTVSGNRVNVRGGPGTDFGIVNRLVRGDDVEILEDNGNGWVRMRPIGGGAEGWMADFLLTGG